MYVLSLTNFGNCQSDIIDVELKMYDFYGDISMQILAPQDGDDDDLTSIWQMVIFTQFCFTGSKLNEGSIPVSNIDPLT